MTDDELVQRAIPAFAATLRNRFGERHDEIRKRIDDAVKTIKYPVILSEVINRPDEAIFPSHAKAVGIDFLNEFYSVVELHCKLLSDEAKRVFYKMFNMQYNAIIDRTETALRSQAKERGVPEPEQFIADTRDVYEAARIRYRMLLDERILKHNLRFMPGTPPKKGKAKKKTRSEMRAIYNSLFRFHSDKRKEYIDKNGTEYGAAKYADKATADQIWKQFRTKVSPRNVRDAMDR